MPDPTVSKKFNSHSSLHLELVILEYCQFSEITSSRWAREILLVIFKIVDSRQSGPNFRKFILFSFAYLDAETFAKKPMPTCCLCLYSTLFHTTCSSLSSSIRRTLFYPIPIPNKYIGVQWFSHTFQQWLFYVYKFFSYDDDAKTAYFKATKCILFTYIYYVYIFERGIFKKWLFFPETFYQNLDSAAFCYLVG